MLGMRRWYGNLSIQHKLTVLSLATAVLAISLASAAVMLLHVSSYRERAAETLQSLGEVAARNSQAALIFQDRHDAERTLASLGFKRDVRAAYLFTAAGEAFAGYAPGAEAGLTTALTHASAEVRALLRAGDTQAAHHHYHDGLLDVLVPVLLEGEPVGYLYLQAHTEALAEQLAQQLGLMSGAVLLSLLLAVGVAARLQRTVAEPLHHLTDAVRCIAEGQDYTIRVPRAFEDEVGTLTGHFNQMLAELEARDQVLQVQQRLLEDEVAARKADHTFLQTVVDTVPDPISVIGTDGQPLLLNRLALELQHEDGMPAWHGQAGSDPLSPLTEVRRSLQPVRMELVQQDVRGEPRFWEISAAPLFAPDGTVTGVVESARDITARKHAEQQLREQGEQLDYLAHHDALTELPNRILFRDRFEQALRLAARHGRTVALLFLDLDRFKNVNDSFGHETGDQLLQMVARRILMCVRTTDTVARLGGDEFALLLSDTQESEGPGRVAEKIMEVIGEPFDLEGREVYIGVSIGISLYPGDGGDVDTLTRNADAAMFLAKEEGRGRYHFFTQTLNERAHRRLLLESHLRRALGRNELEVYYQPQLELDTGRIIGAEALLRWHCAELGAISPAEFIPLAEETGLIIPIGAWVLETACHQVAAWERAGLPALHIAVNLSAQQVRDDTLIATVQRVLDDSGLAPRRLELEVTESMLLKGAGPTLELMSRIKALGARLSIDDFGTGYSSLSYLHRFPLDHLKIAQEFVRDIPHQRNQVAIANAIVALARNLDLRIIVEGLETREQVDFFRQQACDLGQGYYFSRPLPAAEFERLLRQAQPASDGQTT